ncbi:sensor histidine kinase [Frondihabitans cladoniiphilus]|uniref:histidine kinase n=1 Tax=Frondihabitans cladoniiphilus TaxID=715785 RepID=A0ABP8WCE5_9MICO
MTDVPTPSPRRFGYVGLWRALPRELAFLLTVLPVAIVTCVVGWTGLALGLGLAIVWIGLPIGVATLLLSRRFGEFELRRLRLAGRPAIAAPDWSLRHRGQGIWRRALVVLVDGRTWSYWAHGAIVQLVLGTITWSIGLVWIVLALGGPTYWFWGRFESHGDGEIWLHTVVLEGFPGYTAERSQSGLFVGESVFFAVVGVVFLVTLPLVGHGLVLLHQAVARGMLGEGESAALRREISASESSRVSAILAEDDALRRLERDIHDGPQQSLLRVQYDLSSSIRALSSDDETLRPLLESALGLTKDTLHELRELSRGMAPPLLQDRGLASAIRSLASRSPVPTTAAVDLTVGEVDLGPVERSVYFVVSELLANVAKHSGATAASVTIRATVSTGLRARRRRDLVVEVVDDGRGGAREVSGHGLNGVAARVTGLRGTLVVDSPGGGPTRVTVTLPVGSASGTELAAPLR